MSLRKLPVRLATVAWAACALLGGACSTAPPTAPSRAATVLLEYTRPSLEAVSPPPADLAMCFHHFAPANLTVSTSWGFSSRMSTLGGVEGTYGMLLTDVPVGVTAWVAVVDIDWCIQGGPMVKSGVRANGVPLSTVIETPDGTSALQFSVTADGRVRP